MLETQKAFAKRNADVAELARNYREKHGEMNEGFYRELKEFSDKNNLSLLDRTIYRFKLILLGDIAVGKTSILTRYFRADQFILNFLNK